MLKVNQSFISNYSRLTWCLVGCNKLIWSGDRLGFRLANRKLRFLPLSSLIVSAAPDFFINLFKTNYYAETIN